MVVFFRQTRCTFNILLSFGFLYVLHAVFKNAMSYFFRCRHALAFSVESTQRCCFNIFVVGLYVKTWRLSLLFLGRFNVLHSLFFVSYITRPWTKALFNLLATPQGRHYLEWSNEMSILWQKQHDGYSCWDVLLLSLFGATRTTAASLWLRPQNVGIKRHLHPHNTKCTNLLNWIVNEQYNYKCVDV